MKNSGFSDTTIPVPAANGVERSGSYSQRKISRDCNSNKFPCENADAEESTSETRKLSRKESILPDLAPEDPDAKPWESQTTQEKVLGVLSGLLKFVGFLACLYFFICSLDLLSSGFKLLGGEATGKIFQVR